MKINWGTAIVLFFILFVATFISFVIYSLGQNHDLVADDYYKQGANYSAQIKTRERSAAYTDSITIAVGTDRLVISAAPSVIRSADSLKVRLYRPSDKNLDRQKLWVKGDTLLSFDRNTLTHGRYQLITSWQKNGEVYQITKIIDIE